jgi:predicted dehydrogenase
MSMAEPRKLQWGILSTARIGQDRIIPAIARSVHGEVVAIASRDPDKVGAVARRFDIARAHTSYDALLADPDVDAIYNPTPNHMHVDWTLKANAAGKHVLCEKPMSTNAAEASRLRQARPDRLIMEAFMVRFHGQWRRAREILRSGEVGEVRAINAMFTYHNVDPNNLRNRPEAGGGALLDIGCYCIAAGRFFMETEPVRVMALIERDPLFGTDRLVSVIADFGGGRRLSFLVSTQLARVQSIDIMGTKGKVSFATPFTIPPGTAGAISIDAGYSVDGALARREIIPPSDHYANMIDAFSAAALLGEQPEFGIEDAISGMTVIDAILQSEKSGTWAPVRS